MEMTESPEINFIENQPTREVFSTFHSLIGNNPTILRVRQAISQVANSDANVLLLGPSGSGKEVVARNIHAQSSRHSAPFIAINCGAIPEDLLESELFGHEKGSFTGACTTRKGRFELANFGTLFLDEIGDMPLQMQVKLLRVLQEKCFERVGGHKPIEVNVRIIAATHRQLEKEIAAGNFREDLYYRLNVFPIEVPALKDRVSDLGLLIDDLLSKIAADKRPTIQLDAEAFQVLSCYAWPGNVRELANVIERLCIMYPGQTIGIKQLPIKFTQCVKQAQIEKEENEKGVEETHKKNEFSLANLLLPPEGIDLKKCLTEFEKNFIQQALLRSQWIVAHAAKILKLRRTTLIEKMRKYGMTRKVDNLEEAAPQEE